MLSRRKLVSMGLFILICIFLIPMMVFSAEKKVVRVWHTETEPQSVAAFQEIINDFEKLHPDITIKQEALAWGDLEAKLTAALAAGAPPDAAHGQAVTCASFYAKGLLRSQEDIAEAVGKDNIFKAVKMQCFHDGKYYGVPHSPNVSLLIYRKDIFKQKGLKPPETWDDFIKMAQAMMERDKDGRVTRYGLSLPGTPLYSSAASDVYKRQVCILLCERPFAESGGYCRRHRPGQHLGARQDAMFSRREVLRNPSFTQCVAADLPQGHFQGEGIEAARDLG